MVKSKPILVVGDTHGEWEALNTLINKKRPEIVLQTGDFGYWPRFEKFDIRLLKPQDTKVYWCDGNHEDHWSLQQRPSDEVHTNVFYQPRGSVLVIPDGRRVLFIGGAPSIDREVRIMGHTWFPNEVPSNADFEKIDTIEGRIDIVISHTCPLEFKIEDHPWVPKQGIRINDITRTLLSYVLEKFRPKLWYFGHWHAHMKGEHNGTYWRAMNMSPEQNWWMKLE